MHNAYEHALSVGAIAVVRRPSAFATVQIHTAEEMLVRLRQTLAQALTQQTPSRAWIMSWPQMRVQRQGAAA